MHELGVTQAVVELAVERANGRRVTRVVLEIGKLSGVLPDAVRFCFDLCAEGTAAEGAALEIVEPPGRGRCRSCGADVPLDGPLGLCPCGGTDLEWIAGGELRVTELELTDV
ncbi:MAG: hydrogenase maturation nickel metallochaperone HypA [Isosphaera sp.]|nr:hydrogenase maturation nickel metallochaperone HypA [Isosphaera sp.]